MIADFSKRLRIFNVMEGLTEGLSRFCGRPTRVAFLYAEKYDDPLVLYDPHKLLDGHEYRLKELYVDSAIWRSCPLRLDGLTLFGEMFPEKDLGLSGIISYGGRTGNIFYQMWFVEHHPDVASTGPIERWLENAVCVLSHDFAIDDTFYTATSRLVLREYASYAVRDYIMDELNLLIGWDMPYMVSSVLEAILEISRTPEEGFFPEGKLTIIEPSKLDSVRLLMGFPHDEQPSLFNKRHVRKLLTAVKQSSTTLVSDGKKILGIAYDTISSPAIVADFRKAYGFLFINRKLVCSFAEGKFFATTRRPTLVEFEEILVESDLDKDTRDDLLSIVTHIVQEATEKQHGASIVVDLGSPPLKLSGQHLDKPLLLTNRENLALACRLSKLDGAIHIGRDLHLYAFSCLLDGLAVPNENRSRGARFNSALRFSHQHPEVVVITVSADRPVSIFQNGIELTSTIPLETSLSSLYKAPSLEAWLGLK
ncbi:MAG: DNA integrity scanning protein DisA nucleotide-binding domain protein [Syntrophobacterales bacterium]|nr:DNA integrity scanning protein DisA nucleotide-binding domain protein [Syntrophobacterales bacterium]